MFQNGQTHFKNLAVFAARLLKCVWTFWGICIKRLILFAEQPFANVLHNRCTKKFRKFHRETGKQKLAKLLRTPFSTEHLRWLLLYLSQYKEDRQKSGSNSSFCWKSYSDFVSQLVNHFLWRSFIQNLLWKI